MGSTVENTNRENETLLGLASDLVHMLTQAGNTVGVGESLTGGGLGAAFTSVPGSSAVFRGGIVAYATPLKTRLLHVDPDLIDREGVIHGDVALQMAEGARRATTFNDQATTWGIGTTGVAGPDEQDGKPVGTVFIGIACAQWSRGLGPYHFDGSREGIREATVLEALRQLRQVLRDRKP
ncbi:hypothetical protein F4806DRAFT_429622 [Annulohypoxylon nitens]|nr:hypothetical protein F4806DRAFT_429622 [Annulohypoxylon nitens]